MSYDLLLLRLEPGEDPDDALERLEEREDPVPDEAARRRLEEVAAAVHERFPHLDRHDDDAWVELTSLDDSKPYQVSVYADQGGANVPYWHEDERAEETYRELFAILEIVCEKTGWSIYDPQLGRVVTAADLPEIVGMHGGGVRAVRMVTEAEERPPGFFKRLFGRTS